MSDERPIPESLRRVMEAVRKSNAGFWDDCASKNGLSDTTPIRLSANFAVRSTDAEKRLLTALEHRGYVIQEVRRPDEAAGRTWVVFAVPIRTWTLEAWNEWTDQMVLLGGRARVAIFGGIYTIRVVEHDTARLERDRQEQRTMNLDTCAQLQKHGVNPETELSLDANFWADDEPTAMLLAAHLRHVLGYAVEVDPPKRRLLRAKTPWNVTSTTPPATRTPAIIDAWTDQMVQIAHLHEADFDGWGTMLPS